MQGKYKVITLCGSTRFKDEFIEAQKRLTLEGNIVISVGLFGHSGDNEVMSEGVKEMLDDMHKRKIDMADEIFVINPGGYIGSSTRSEIDYASACGKPVKYLCEAGKTPELFLELSDNEWEYTYTDHDRMIARGIAVDGDGYFYFVRAERDDDFGRATLIETSGGGVEDGEELCEAARRELKEELGADAEVVCRIGVVSDYYNLIHRHNINNYFLCRVRSFGEKALTEQEVCDFKLSTLKLTYEEAVAEYGRRANTGIGRLIAARELSVLARAKEILDKGVLQTR